MNRSDRRFDSVKKVLWLQVTIAVIAVSAVYLIKHDSDAFFAAVMGGCIAVIPTVLYVKIAFKYGLVVSPEVALNRHKKAFLIRFITSSGMFLLVFLLYRGHSFGVMFIVYFIVLLAYWLSLIKF